MDQPLWQPSAERIAASNLTAFMRYVRDHYGVVTDEYAQLYAWSIDERSNYTPWQPVIWPLRGVVPLTALLLFLQGVSELLKSLWAAKTGVLLTHHETIEL